MQFDQSEILKEFTNYLATSVVCSVESLSEFKSAVEYALLNGGKRIRPMSYLAVLHAFGKEVKPCFPIAAALEYIHCYSLVHDDLPAMDNDDFRRGKPTVHKIYGDATAILVGDALLTGAFKLLADLDNISADKRVKLISMLSNSAGIGGMVGGQYLDTQMNSPKRGMSQLVEIQRLKTGKMISASIEMALLTADVCETLANPWIQLGKSFGEFFQIRDDLMDKNATLRTLGKLPGGDAEKQKLTYPNLAGNEKSEKILEAGYRKITGCLENIAGDTGYFRDVSRTLYDSYLKTVAG